MSVSSRNRALEAGGEGKKETNNFKIVPEFAIELISREAKKERDEALEKIARYVEMGVDLDIRCLYTSRSDHEKGCALRLRTSMQ